MGGVVVSEQAIRSILKHFPAQCNYAFAYGSAVFAQQNQKLGKMIDLIFVVDNPVEWHTQNLERNRHHYSGLKIFGPKLITTIQERFACGVYYNPFVNVEGQLIKYGVISTKSLEEDLIRWNRIYIAGRLHKPVMNLHGPVCSHLTDCLKRNHESALRAVLLQEGRYISKFSLYHGITELSYLGDSRMRLAETPHKTKNIVVPLMHEFDKLYLPLIKNLDPQVELDEKGVLVQDTTPQARFKHLMGLPHPVQASLARQMFRDPRLFDIEEVMAELSYLPQIKIFIRSSISEVVFGSSLLQTIQGIMSAGVIRSGRYAYEKLQKGLGNRFMRKEPEIHVPSEPKPPDFDPTKPIGPLKDYQPTLKESPSVLKIKTDHLEIKMTKEKGADINPEKKLKSKPASVPNKEENTENKDLTAAGKV